MIPTRDVGFQWNWQQSTGQWWRALAPIPKYRITEGAPCDDGALYEVSGNGTITSRVGFIDTGFSIEFYILAPSVGTHCIVNCWSSLMEPRSGFEVSIQFMADRIRISACDKTKDILIPYIDYLNKVRIIYFDQRFVIISVGETPSPNDLLICCDVSISGGWKYSLTNASGSDENGPIPLIIDDLVVAKELVYPNRPETSQVCMGISPCQCFREDNGKRREDMPAALTLRLHYECHIEGQEGVYDEYYTLKRVRIECDDLISGTVRYSSDPWWYCRDSQPGLIDSWIVVCEAMTTSPGAGFGLILGYSGPSSGDPLEIDQCYPKLKFKRLTSAESVHVIAHWFTNKAFCPICQGQFGSELSNIWIEIYEE